MHYSMPKYLHARTSWIPGVWMMYLLILALLESSLLSWADLVWKIQSNMILFEFPDVADFGWTGNTTGS